MKIDKVLEDYANCRVPKDKRKSLLHLCVIVFSAVVTIPIFMIAQTIVYGVGFYEGIFGIMISVVFIMLLSLFTSYIGAKTNLTLAMISQRSFGKYGGKVISFILGITLIMWFAITIDFFGSSFTEILNNSLNIHMSDMLITVIAGLLMMSSAIVGFKGLDRVSIFFFPILITIIIYMMIYVSNDANVGLLLSQRGSGSIGLTDVISLMIGTCILGILFAPDITRFSKTPSQGMMLYFISYIIFLPLVLAIFMFLLKVSGQSSFAELVNFLSIGAIGLLFLFAATWTTNDNNLYSSSLAVSRLFEKTPKWKVASILGVFGIFLGVSKIFSYFIIIMTILGVLIIPVFSVVVADYFIFNKDSYGKQNIKYNWNMPAILAWELSVILGVCTISKAEFGLGLFNLTTIPSIDALICSFILYIIFKKVVGKNV